LGHKPSEAVAGGETFKLLCWGCRLKISYVLMVNDTLGAISDTKLRSVRVPPVALIVSYELLYFDGATRRD